MDHITSLMLALLRSSFSHTPPAALPASSDEWAQVYWLARKHGVVTMINDVIDRLPADQQPQGDIALSWSLSAERTRYHYEHQSQVLDTLRRQAAEQGLQILVLKGLSLSRYYPVPSSRACGDIDIAFLPCNQPYTMTPDQLVNAAKMVKPKVVFPYHYGQTDISHLPDQLKSQGMEVRIRQLQ